MLFFPSLFLPNYTCVTWSKRHWWVGEVGVEWITTRVGSRETWYRCAPFSFDFRSCPAVCFDSPCSHFKGLGALNPLFLISFFITWLIGSLTLPNSAFLFSLLNWKREGGLTSLKGTIDPPLSLHDYGLTKEKPFCSRTGWWRQKCEVLWGNHPKGENDENRVIVWIKLVSSWGCCKDHWRFYLTKNH